MDNPKTKLRPNKITVLIILGLHQFPKEEQHVKRVNPGNSRNIGYFIHWQEQTAPPWATVLHLVVRVQMAPSLVQYSPEAQ